MKVRFSINKISPYGKIFKDDIVLVKKAGACGRNIYRLKAIRFYSALNVNKLKEIENLYAVGICSNVDALFWKNRENSKFATLIEISAVTEVNPFIINKSDRTAWSIVQNKLLSLFDNHSIMIQIENSIILIGMTCSGPPLPTNFGLTVQKASFGGYLFDYATKNNLDTKKENLQIVGQGFIDNDYKKSF